MNLAESNNTFMMEAMWMRFMPSIRKILGIVSSGIIGELVSIKASVSYDKATAEQLTGITGQGDMLVELGTYPVFLCVLFLGKPDYVEGTSSATNNGANQFFSAFLSYNESNYAFIEASSINRGDSQVTIEGEQGRIHMRNPWSTKPEDIEVIFFNGTKNIEKVEWEGSGFQFEVDEVYKSLKEGYIESQLYCHHFNLDVIQTMDELRLKLK
jgi:predicted dehydrogenase